MTKKDLETPAWNTPLTTDRLRRWLKILREMCPTLLPVQVRFLEKTDGNVASTHLLYDDDTGLPARFVIQLDRPITVDSAAQALVHEWAHCLSWSSDRHDTVCDHDPEFGLAYSRVYQEFIQP